MTTDLDKAVERARRFALRLRQEASVVRGYSTRTGEASEMEQDADAIEALIALARRSHDASGGDELAFHAALIDMLKKAIDPDAWDRQCDVVEENGSPLCAAHMREWSAERRAMLSAAPPASVGREEIAGMIADKLDDGMGGLPQLEDDLTLAYIDVANVNLGEIADAILAALGRTG